MLKWERRAKGTYACRKNGAVITRDGSLWRRSEGPARARGWYPTLADAKQGQGGRRVWHRRTRGQYERIDGVVVRHAAPRGASGCWQVIVPPGLVADSQVYGSRLAAQRAAARLVPLQAGSRGGPRPPEERRPDRASAAAERVDGSPRRPRGGSPSRSRAKAPPAAADVNPISVSGAAGELREGIRMARDIDDPLAWVRRAWSDVPTSVAHAAVEELGQRRGRTRDATLRTAADLIRTTQRTLRQTAQSGPAPAPGAAQWVQHFRELRNGVRQIPYDQFDAVLAPYRALPDVTLAQVVRELGFSSSTKKADIARLTKVLTNTKRALRQTDRI